MERRSLKVVVACSNANGAPDLVPVNVTCTATQYQTGEHYDRAKAFAEEHGYEEPMVAIDENDPPKMLFELYVWPTIATVAV